MGDDFLFPLVDEPIGAIVDRIQSEEAALAALAASPRRQPVAGEEGTWVDQLLADPEVIEAVRAEVRAVAEEVASDPSLAEPVGPDEATRERFRAFARRLGR